jgi:muramoyltetrapeptide carboxypeptidase LdcA involved in peptidoglycan recycling
MKSLKELILERITRSQLYSIEYFADDLLSKWGVDVEFTKHFLDRLNDERNGEEIRAEELISIFQKMNDKGIIDKVTGKVDIEAVLKDIQTQLNLPFVIDIVYNNAKKKKEFVITFKTVMRKKDFKTSNKVIHLK